MGLRYGMQAGNFGGGMSLEDMERKRRAAIMASGAGGASSKALRLQAEKAAFNKKMSNYLSPGDAQAAKPVPSNIGKTAGQGAAIVQGAEMLTGEEGGVGGTTGGALSGAAAGAAAGAAFGPYGALIGGAIGGVSGGLKAKRARKKAQAEAEAGHQLKLAEIEGEKEKRIQAAMKNMADNIGSTLRSVG